jgi:tetratricopeptide (TPR) repeat protein
MADRSRKYSGALFPLLLGMVIVASANGVAASGAAAAERGMALGARKFVQRGNAEVVAGNVATPVFVNRGIAYAQKNAWQLALNDFNEAANRNPSDASIYYNRGLMYMRHGVYDAAIADFTTTIALEPRHAEALAARGAAHQALADNTAAMADYYRALAIDPVNRNASTNLNRLLSVSGFAPAK